MYNTNIAYNIFTHFWGGRGGWGGLETLHYVEETPVKCPSVLKIYEKFVFSFAPYRGMEGEVELNKQK